MSLYNNSVPIVNRILRLLLLLILGVLIVGLCVSLAFTIVDLRQFFTVSPETGVKTMVINTLQLLALVEIIATVQGYIRDGRIKVTFIIDAALIILIKEIVTVWYKAQLLTQAYELIVLALLLMGLRIASILVSPKNLKKDT